MYSSHYISAPYFDASGLGTKNTVCFYIRREQKFYSTCRNLKNVIFIGLVFLSHFVLSTITIIQ